MKIQPEQLIKHLGEKLCPVYLVSGDEPLLVQESCDQIRNTAREKGYTDRELLHGASGDENILLSATQTMSLFAEQRIFEYRFQKAPTKEFQQAFKQWCDNPQEDQILLISCAKLDKRTKNTVWYKHLVKTGAHIEVWPVDIKKLPGWLAVRTKKAGLNLNREALDVLTDRIEGNLLAAQQEIDRLSLLFTDSGAITAEMMLEYVADNSRFNSFELLDASFAGNSRRLTRILTGLKLEGEAIAKINSLLTYELRKLTSMAWDCQKGATTAQVMRKYYVWHNKIEGYTQSLKRYPVSYWQRILTRCLELDKIIKGQTKGDPWTVLESLLLQISGNGLWKSKR